MGGKKFIALLFSALNYSWKRRPSVSVKIFMFFLSLETSTVAFRSVLDELLCFFFALNLTSFRYFFRNLSLLLSCLLFGENLPRKFPRNSREIGRFLREFVPSNPAKFHFFPANYQKPWGVLNCSYLLHSFLLKRTSLLPPTCIMCIFCYVWPKIMRNKASTAIKYEEYTVKMMKTWANLPPFLTWIQLVTSQAR